MPKAGELDWSDLYDKTNDQKLEKSKNPKFDWLDYRHPNNKKEQTKAPEPILKKGEVPRKPSNEEIANYILKDMANNSFRQATDKEMFGHLIPTEEQICKAEEDYQNKINNFYKTATKPIGKPVDESWSGGTSFLDSLTPEERAKFEAGQKEADKHNL